MKNKIFIALIIIFSHHVYGQDPWLNALDSARLKTGIQPVKHKPDIRRAVIKVLTSQIMENNDAFWKKPVNVPYLFAIAFSFDNSGMVENVFFSRGLSEAKRRRLHIDSALITKLKSLDLRAFNHREEVVMFPILFLDYHTKEMTLENGFIDDYLQLWPQMDAVADNKKLTLLDPYYNQYGSEI